MPLHQVLGKGCCPHTWDPHIRNTGNLWSNEHRVSESNWSHQGGKSWLWAPNPVQIQVSPSLTHSLDPRPRRSWLSQRHKLFYAVRTTAEPSHPCHIAKHAKSRQEFFLLTLIFVPWTLHLLLFLAVNSGHSPEKKPKVINSKTKPCRPQSREG